MIVLLEIRSHCKSNYATPYQVRAVSDLELLNFGITQTTN